MSPEDESIVVLQGEDGAVYKVPQHHLTQVLAGQDFRYSPEAEEDSYNLFEAPYEGFWVQELINAAARFDAGNWLALLDAIQICEEQHLELPGWTNDGLRRFFVESLNGGLGRKGRGNTPLAKARDALARIVRKRTVQEIRNAQKLVSQADTEEVKNLWLMLALPDETKRLLSSGKLKSIGETADDAIEIAHLSLAGTFARGTVETIRKQYYSADEFNFQLSHGTLVLLGLATDDLPAAFGGFGVMVPKAPLQED
jgi:hypothetical protein